MSRKLRRDVMRESHYSVTRCVWRGTVESSVPGNITAHTRDKVEFIHVIWPVELALQHDHWPLLFSSISIAGYVAGIKEIGNLHMHMPKPMRSYVWATVTPRIHDPHPCRCYTWTPREWLIIRNLLLAVFLLAAKVFSVFHRAIIHP
ncbi:hypothetical protein OBBRIDRAFT_790825 [Obba rivulosa]|uniref:Transmembrane protein n=1 Tax=Obba rivulosa TaxID=1052685 RepID=A0A8E2B2T7_9APHY|nr:hypothetical protein OBBRIDRAFT_790825 [Obba rivulosa]